MIDSFSVQGFNGMTLLAQAAEKADAAKDVPWYMTPNFLVAIGLVAIVFASFFIGNWIAKRIRSEDHGWKLAVIFGSIASAILLCAFLFPPKFGVDLRGGTTFIGQLNEQDLLPGQEAIEAADIIGRLTNRVDPSGTREIRIRALGTDKIEVTIPDVDNEEAMRIWNRLTKTGLLQFRIVADEKHVDITSRARALIDLGITDRLVREAASDARDNESGKIIGKWYEMAREIPNDPDSDATNMPFKFAPSVTHLVRNSKTKALVIPPSSGGQTMGPGQLARWCETQEIPGLEILLVEPEGPDDRSNVEGSHLQSSTKGYDEQARPCINFTMTGEGARRMGYLTTMNKPSGSHKALLAIVVDGHLISAPSIDSTITTRGRILGSFSDREVEDMVVNLRSGRIEVALNKNPISQQFVESNLGADLKQKGLMAIGISFVVVILFMLFYYRFSGVVACLALFLNLLFIIVIVMLIKQPLTLTGLAGLVLTVGMSVDANVLIFERIREELQKGAALRMAIRNGFDRATTTIVDANVTTLITAIVLYVIGTEQVKGFSVTLILGILMSMFTAIFCSRVVFEIAERRRWITKLNMMRLVGKTQIDFIGKRHIAMVVSLIVIFIGMAATFQRGRSILDHDLAGGSTARIVFAENVSIDADAIRAALKDYSDPELSNDISFSVSAIQSDEYPDREFKIDSNIPPWEENGEPPYKEIDEALMSVFGDKMMMLKLDYDPSKIQVTRLDAPEANGNGSSSVPSENNSQRGPLTTPSLSAMSVSALTMMVQDNGENQESPNDESNQKENDPSANNKPQDEKEDASESDDDATGGQADNPQTDSTAQDDEDSQAPEFGKYEAKVTLNFGQPTSRRGLIDALVTAAETSGRVSLNEVDVAVDTADADPDDPLVKSKTWDVTLSLSKPGDAQVVLDELRKEYDGKPYLPTHSGVGGQVAGEAQFQALAAIIASLIGIIAYVWIRFQNVAFGLAAVVALVHDVLVVLGAIAVSYWVQSFLGIPLIDNFKISLTVVAAFLTIVGYSLNDTIVVFDRIREVRGKRTELTQEMINTSISQTLGRTILTSLTTFIVVFLLFVLGGEAIHGFAFALVVGVIVGTYSSIFVASPVLLWLMNRSKKTAEA